MIKVYEEKEDSGLLPDLTPLLDVLFIILFFFMLTASSLPDSFKVDLPASSAASVTAPKQIPVKLTIFSDHSGWGINGSKYKDWHAFSQAVLQKVGASFGEKSSVMIASDKNASVQQLIQLMTFLQKNHIKTASLLTTSPE